ncbi:MAG: NAD(P)-dependent oxidoreductase [Bacillota bacterium]|nr:NAD(P)-dependent oxidoreductase [Bacillota bacterium]
MRILVTGAGGMLGRDMTLELAARRHDVIALAHGDLDIADIGAVRERISALRPDVVVNCAAYTRVDDAERDRQTAFATNALGPRNLALACRRADAVLLHISTDYVFDGEKGEPYTIWDLPSPLNVYGTSKWWGENYVRSLLPEHYLVRTSWLFGEHGRNFVTTMLRMADRCRADELESSRTACAPRGVAQGVDERASVRPAREGATAEDQRAPSSGRQHIPVVADQQGSPTYTVDLAKACADLLETGCFGIYHVTNQGVTTWYEFAKAIFARAGLAINVRPVTSDEFARPARRPRNSALDAYPLRETIGYVLPPWEDALARFLSGMGKAQEHREG